MAKIMMASALYAIADMLQLPLKGNRETGVIDGSGGVGVKIGGDTIRFPLTVVSSFADLAGSELGVLVKSRGNLLLLAGVYNFDKSTAVVKDDPKTMVVAVVDRALVQFTKGTNGKGDTGDPLGCLEFAGVSDIVSAIAYLRPGIKGMWRRKMVDGQKWKSEKF